jgi:hypothetical protein
MAYLPPDLFRGGRNGRVAPTIGGSPFSNFRQVIRPGDTSAEQQAIDLITKRSQMAHDLLTRARIDEANRDIQSIQFARPDQVTNLFSRPRDAQDAALQRLVQGDINAKERGVALIPDWKTMQAYEKGILSNLGLAEDINDSRFSRDLRSATLAQQQARDFAAMMNQQQQREHAQQQLEAQERYRQAQIGNAEANRGQRDRQFGMTQAQRDFQNMINIEKMLQERADEEARQGRALYGDVSRAAERGAIPESDIATLFGSSLDPSMLGLAQGYAKQYQRGQSDFDTMLRLQAESANQQLAGADPDMREYTAQSIQRSLDKNRTTGGRIVFDPSSGGFIPVGLSQSMDGGYGDEPPLSDDLGLDIPMALMNAGVAASRMPMQPRQAPVAQPRRQQFSEGQVIRNRRTGQVFQVRGGQLVPIR